MLLHLTRKDYDFCLGRYHIKEKMNNIKFLDCTLRDGGYVNEAKFGQNVIKALISSLAESGVDFIELGFLKNGEFTNEESNYSNIEGAEKNVCLLKPNQRYSVMIRPDWYDMEKIEEKNGLIDLIRFAFYFRDIELTKRYCMYVKDRGYEFILNPVNIMGYNKETLKKLFEEINIIKPYGVTIVDTLGSIQMEDLESIYELFETYVDKNITIGLHLHENMSSSFQLAQRFINIKNMKRNAIIDGSLLGMGRIPGNLCIELILDYANNLFPGRYNLLPLLDSISEYINPIKKKKEWGYSPAFYFSGKMQVHRSYPEYFLEKTNFNLAEIYIALCEIEKEDNKTAFSVEKAKGIEEKIMREKVKKKCK